MMRPDSLSLSIERVISLTRPKSILSYQNIVLKRWRTNVGFSFSECSHKATYVVSLVIISSATRGNQTDNGLGLMFLKMISFQKDHDKR